MYEFTQDGSGYFNMLQVLRNVYIAGYFREKVATRSKNSVRSMAVRLYLVGRFQQAVMRRGLNAATDLEETLADGSVPDWMNAPPKQVESWKKHVVWGLECDLECDLGRLECERREAWAGWYARKMLSWRG